MMNAISTLATEYPGDSAWKAFVSVFDGLWTANSDKEKYLGTIENEEIALVLAARLGEDALRWFSSPCNALQGRTPDDVFRNEPRGVQILRTLLMRMPM
jgi:hypothetical protein